LADLIKLTNEVMARVKQNTYTATSCILSAVLELASNISSSLLVHRRNKKVLCRSVTDLICILKKDNLTGFPLAFLAPL